MPALILLAALLALLGPCEPTKTWTYVVGARAEVPLHGCCLDRARGDAVEFQDGVLRAVRPGEVRVPCVDEELRLVVQAPHRLVVEGPDDVPGEGAAYTLRAFDEGGRPLDIGDEAEVDWRLPPELRATSRCHDVLGRCDAPWQITVRPRADASPGTVRLSAKLGDAEATRAVRVHPPAQ